MTFKKSKTKLIGLGLLVILVGSVAGLFFDPGTSEAQNPNSTLGYRKLKPDEIEIKMSPFTPTNFFRVLVDKDGPVDEAGSKDNSVKGDPIKVSVNLSLTKPDKLYISGYEAPTGWICIPSLPCPPRFEGWDNLYVDQIFPTEKGIRGIGIEYTSEPIDKSCSAGTVLSTKVKSCSYANYSYVVTTNTIFPTYYTVDANKDFPAEIVLNQANRAKYGINKASDTGELNTLNVIPFLGYASYVVPGTTNDAAYIDGVKPIKVKVYANTDAGKAAYLADKDKPPEDSDNTGSNSTAATGGSAIGDIINQFVTVQILIFTRIIYWLFANVLAPLIEALLQVHPYKDIFVEVIYLGWQLIRNLCNIFFIVVLLVIGLGTLFRVESYNYKHLLVKVVIAALLVNFSLVFGQAILGVADTVQAQFLPDSANVIRALGSKLMVEPINILTSDENFRVGNSTSAGASFANIARPMFAFALALGAFFAFVAIAAFLVIRLIALWILLLVSPIAYVANVLPMTSNYGKEWWNKFLKYAFMTPVLAFFLNLAAVFATTFLKDQANFQKLLSASNVDGEISKYVFLAGSQILVILFILVGLKAAASSGTYGAAAVTEFAEKGMKKPFQWAGTKTLAGAKAGAERGFEGLQNKMGLTLDPRLLKKAGSEYFAEQKAKRLQTRATRNFMGMKHGPKLGDAKSNFEAYANWRGVKRAVSSGPLGMRGAGYYTKKYNEAKPYASLKTDDEVKLMKDKRFYNSKALNNRQAQKQQLEIDLKTAEAATKADPKNDAKRAAFEDKQNEYNQFMRTKINPLTEENDRITAELKKDEQLKKDLIDPKTKQKGISSWDEASQKEWQDKKKAYDDKITSRKRPEGYAAIAAHHHLLSDEEKKISHIDDSDRLVQLYKDALAQGERYKAEAVLHKLAKDTNFNEITTELYGGMSRDHSQRLFEDFGKAFGVDKHGILELASEVGYINEGVNMYNGARLTTVDKHGHMDWATKEQHEAAIEAQMKKVEPQGQARNFWRGAFLNEQQNDKGGKDFKLHDAGVKILQDSLSKGAGLRGVAERMQEYNRNAIAKAIRSEVENNAANARASVKALYNNKDLMRALEMGKYDSNVSK